MAGRVSIRCPRNPQDGWSVTDCDSGKLLAATRIVLFLTQNNSVIVAEVDDGRSRQSVIVNDCVLGDDALPRSRPRRVPAA